MPNLNRGSCVLFYCGPPYDYFGSFTRIDIRFLCDLEALSVFIGLKLVEVFMVASDSHDLYGNFLRSLLGERGGGL